MLLKSPGVPWILMFPETPGIHLEPPGTPSKRYWNLQESPKAPGTPLWLPETSFRASGALWYTLKPLEITLTPLKRPSDLYLLKIPVTPLKRRYDLLAGPWNPLGTPERTPATSFDSSHKRLVATVVYLPSLLHFPMHIIGSEKLSLFPCRA